MSGMYVLVFDIIEEINWKFISCYVFLLLDVIAPFT